MRQIYYNGEIIPMTNETDRLEAVYVENGRICETGSFKELSSRHAKAARVDLKGATMFPGFIDGHSHIVSTAFELMFGNANPSPKGKCDSVELLVSELTKQFQEKKSKLKKGDWFVAMGYDESAYPDKQPPSKHDLDKITTEYPVLVIHASGHNGVFNSRALEAAGVTDDYEVPTGGGMPKFPGTNEYTGLLQENAFINLSSGMKTPGLRDVMTAFSKCIELYASFGITTAQDAKVMKQQYSLIKMASLLGKMKIDVACYMDPECAEGVIPTQNPRENPYKRHVRIAGYKLFLDGSPQAKTAWLTEPYHIPPAGKAADYVGFGTMTDEELIKHLRLCMSNHWQVNIHTNGDAAIDQFLHCFELVKREYEGEMDLRPVFIHCQTAREDQLDKMKQLGMLISFFEDHVYYWGDFHYESVLGPKRGERISPLRSARERGINCTLHQDSPVVHPNAMFAVHNAVNRVTKGGRLLGADQRVSVYEALRCVTYAGAYQLFEEEHKGTIEVGKMADFVIVDQNPYDVDADKIKDIKVLKTIKEGRLVYEA